MFFDSTSSGDPKILIDGRSLIIRDGTFDTTGSELLRITSNGRLLASRGGLTASRNVGTKTGEIQVANTGNSSAISIIGYSNDVGGPHLMFGKSRSTNATGSTIVQDGDRLGEIAFCGADGSDIDSFGAAIKCHVDGTPGANDMPGRLEFYTTSDGGSSSVERLRIGSNGSMYLGYNSSDGFPVQDGSIPGNLRLFSIHGTGTSLGIKLTNSTTGTTTGDGVDIRLHGQTAMINQNETYDLQLRSKGELAFRTGNPHTERLRITSTEINAKIPITGAVPAPNRNIIENGEFLVSQRMGDAASTKASSGSNIQNGIENGIVDRWRMGSPSASNFSRQRVTDAPSGFAYSFKVTNDGTQYNPGNANYSLFQQIIEAPNVARLAFGTSSAKTVTLSFYVKSSYASSTWAVALGSLTGGVYTSATRTYIKSYSISSANTWERKTITFPGDTSGTWPKTGTGGGLAVVWDLGSGGNHQGTSQNTWASSADFRFSGAKNVGDAANGSWQITGIQLEIGDTATEYEHIPIQKEIERCQRYFYCSGLLGSGSWNSTNTFHCAVHHPVAMRGRVTVGGTRSGGYSNINIEPRDQYDITVFDPDAHTHHVPDQVHSNQVMNFTISGSTTTGYSGTVAMDRNSDQFWLSAEL